MQVKLILIKFIFTTKQNQKYILPNKPFEINNNSSKEMVFEFNNKELKKYKKPNEYEQFYNFKTMHNPTIVSFCNTNTKNSPFDEGKKIDLNTEILLYNNFNAKKNKNRSNINNNEFATVTKKLVLQKKTNLKNKQNKDINQKFFELQCNEDLYKFTKIKYNYLKKLNIEKRCIYLSKCQLNLLKKTKFNLFQFKLLSNELFLLVLHRINSYKYMRFAKNNYLINSKKSELPNDELSLNTKKNFIPTLSLTNCNDKKYESHKLSTNNGTTLKTCSHYNYEKNKKRISKTSKPQCISLFEQNSLIQSDIKNTFRQNTNLFNKNMLLKVQMNPQKECNLQHCKKNSVSQHQPKNNILNKINHKQKHNSSTSSLSDLAEFGLNTEKKDLIIPIQHNSNKSHETMIEIVENSKNLSKVKSISLNDTSKIQKMSSNINIKEKHIINNNNTKIKFQTLPSMDSSMPSYFYCGSLSMCENEENDSSESDSTESNTVESFEPALNEKFNSYVYKPKKYIQFHKNPDGVKIFSTAVNFLDANYFKHKGFKKEIQNFPEGFTFSHGWRKYRLNLRNMHKDDLKVKFWLLICKEYNLEPYFLLIFNMIKINTHSKNTRSLSVEICFHICCYHFCTFWNLGQGKNFKLSENCIFNKFINNKNYRQLYKTKHYWSKKAEILYEKASKRAFDELEITTSCFDNSHLYNILLLLPFQNSYSVAFVCFVYHASIDSQVDSNLDDVTSDKHNLIIKKRKIIKKILQKYSKYKNIANQYLISFQQFV
ncbi:hypothetical protein NUSPORA_00908 [Nucleospora cyclopteri]